MRNRISLETWAQVDVAIAAGIGLREIARNMEIPAGTVLAHAKRKGLRQRIESAKNAAQSEQSSAIEPLQSVAVAMQQRGQRHVERMAGISERVVGHVETMGADEVLDSIHEVEKLDRVARRTYGLGDSHQPGGTLSLNILLNQAAVQIVA